MTSLPHGSKLVGRATATPPPVESAPTQAPAGGPAKAGANPAAPLLGKASPPARPPPAGDGLEKTPRRDHAPPAPKPASAMKAPAARGVSTGKSTPSPTVEARRAPAAAGPAAAGPPSDPPLDDAKPLQLDGQRTLHGKKLKAESVYMVRPGIAVQVNFEHGLPVDFVKFVDKQLGAIEKTEVGRQLLEALAKAGPPHADKGLYAGVGLLFTPLAHALSATGTQAFEPPQTDAVVGPTPKGHPQRRGDSDLDAPAIARIQLPRLGAGEWLVYGQAMQPVGKVELAGSAPKGTIVLGSGSVARHPDFPDGTTYDTVVFHELVHAYLQQTGVSAQLQKALPGDTFMRAEEALVVGLKDPKGVDAQGLYFSENTYRLEAKLPLRSTYQSRDITGSADPAAWGGAGGKDQYAASLSAAAASVGVKV